MREARSFGRAFFHALKNQFLQSFLNPHRLLLERFLQRCKLLAMAPAQRYLLA